MRSLSRFTDRSKVDLPHPDGPISAVTFPRDTGIEMSNSALLLPYQREKFFTSRTGSSVASDSWTVGSIFLPLRMASMTGYRDGARSAPNEPCAVADTSEPEVRWGRSPIMVACMVQARKEVR